MRKLMNSSPRAPPINSHYFSGRPFATSGSTTPDQMTAALLRLRSSTSDLRNRGIVPSSTLGILEEEIGWALVSVRQADEGARDLLKQAVADLKQSLAKNPEDKETRSVTSAMALLLSGYLAEDAGQFEDALNCFEQTAAIQMAVYPSDSMNTCLLEVSTGDCQASRRSVQEGRGNAAGGTFATPEPADTPLLPRLGRCNVRQPNHPRGSRCSGRCSGERASGRWRPMRIADSAARSWTSSLNGWRKATR